MSPKSLNGAGQAAADAKTANGAGALKVDSAHADPHGRAALLLVESLIHELVAKSLLTRGEAIDIIDIAIDVDEELALVAGHEPPHHFGSPLVPLAATFRNATGG